jgi:hypothetical protein
MDSDEIMEPGSLSLESYCKFVRCVLLLTASQSEIVVQARDDFALLIAFFG